MPPGGSANRPAASPKPPELGRRPTGAPRHLTDNGRVSETEFPRGLAERLRGILAAQQPQRLLLVDLQTLYRV